MSQLSVVIVSWNTRDLLVQCLESVYADQQAPEFEVWVVDNGSSDGSLELVRQRFPQTQVVANDDNLGFARANNQALGQISSPFALLLNSDAVLPSNAIVKLLACMSEHPQAAAVGPLYLNADGSFQASYGNFPTLATELLLLTGLARWLLGLHYPSQPVADMHQPRLVDWVPGACLLVRMQAMRHVGLLDEGYFFYSEEVDWCYRLRQQGWQVWFVPTVAVTHHLSQSARLASQARLRNLYAGKMRFFSKHYGPWPALWLKCGLLASLWLRAAAALLRVPPGAQARESWHMYLDLADNLRREPTRFLA
jgi:N-acetylglucosaminyl-diphospho-decaprenol L-rhamnosyltransferase